MAQLLSIILVIVATLIGSWGSLLFKIGSKNIALNVVKLLKNYPIIIGCFLYGISSIIFVIALKGEELSVLYPFVSLSYIWVSIMSIRFLNEKMNMWKWAGIVLIIVGVSFIGMGI